VTGAVSPRPNGEPISRTDPAGTYTRRNR